MKEKYADSPYCFPAGEQQRTEKEQTSVQNYKIYQLNTIGSFEYFWIIQNAAEYAYPKKENGCYFFFHVHFLSKILQQKGYTC